MREIIFRAKVKDKNELIGKGFRIDENGNLKSECIIPICFWHGTRLVMSMKK